MLTFKCAERGRLRKGQARGTNGKVFIVGMYALISVLGCDKLKRLCFSLITMTVRLTVRPGRRPAVTLLALLVAAATVYGIHKYVQMDKIHKARYPIYPENDLGIFEELCLEHKVDSSDSNPDDSTRKYLLVVLVLSRPDAIERRNAIRHTWMKKYKEALKKKKVLIKFSIGTIMELQVNC